MIENPTINGASMRFKKPAIINRRLSLKSVRANLI
jgi:hypothetical protein